MAERLDLKELVEGYTRNLQHLTKTIAELEKESQTIQGQLQARRASQREIEDSQREIAALEGERADLLGRWTQAEFEDDLAEKKQIKRRRVEIDQRIAELEEDIRRIRLRYQEVESTHAATIAAQRDMLRVPSIMAFMDKLKEALTEDANEVRKRIGQIHVDQSAYTSDEYQKIRAGRDHAYAQYLSRERRLAEADAARRAKMRPVSSTDQMHALQTRRRKADQPVSVTSSDDTGVLSGDQIRATLAAKQAAE